MSWPRGFVTIQGGNSCQRVIRGCSYSPCYAELTRNVFINLAGNIQPMPFDTKRNGLWRFDGQVFYQGNAR